MIEDAERAACSEDKQAQRGAKRKQGKVHRMSDNGCEVACLSQQFMALEIKAQSVLNHLIACYELWKKTHYCGILLYKTTCSRKDIQTICNIPQGSLYQFRILSRELHQVLSDSQRSNKSCVFQYGAIKFGDSQTCELITRQVKCKKKKSNLQDVIKIQMTNTFSPIREWPQ